jgi:hypothetical protein
MALVDELVGVKAELVQARLRAENAEFEANIHAEELIEELAEVKQSVTWRLGRAMLLPIRVARRLRQR